MREYHHTGVITSKKQPNEVYVDETKVWATNPDDHPYRIEYLRPVRAERAEIVGGQHSVKVGRR